MKKVLLAILLLIVVAVLAVLALAAAKPDDFRVERTADVAAPASRVYTLVNDFHRWPEWSPWEKLDPGMRRSFDGPPSGVGASYAWAGNNDVGEGKMTITASDPDARVDIRLEFLKPWKATNECRFQLDPADAGTRVTWSMSGRNDFMTKVFTVFMDMDQMVGKDFETGLSSLRTLSEAEGAAADSLSTP